MQINCSYIISFLYRFQGRKLMFCILFVHLSEMCKLLGYLFLIFYGKKSISSWTSLLSRRILRTRYLYCTDIFKIEGWCFADQLYVYEMCILLDFFFKHQLLWLKKNMKKIFLWKPEDMSSLQLYIQRSPQSVLLLKCLPFPESRRNKSI